MFESATRFWAVALTLSFWSGISVLAQDDAPGSSHVEVYGMPMEVVEVMSRQLVAWNSADLVGFMDGYWKSDSLRFVGGKGVTHGHRATLERYIQGYPDAKAMGTLTFVNEEWISLGSEAGWLLGSWHLEKEGSEDAQGMYTLLWRRLNGQWVIVADHSS